MSLPFAKKSLGQHWLHDDSALQAILDAGEVDRGDTVLEIGPGTGTLTEKIIKSGAQVVAVEKDPELTNLLVSKFSNHDVYLHNEDILKFDLTGLPVGYKVIANIPYYLTSHIIRLLSESTNPPKLAVLLVQKEVAQRVAAPPGQMSLLSVSAQFYWQVSCGIIVPARLFEPPPKVDSQILILRRRARPLYAQINADKYFSLVKAGFSNRRKTLSNSLAGGLHLSKQGLSGELAHAGIDPQIRPQELSLDDWHKIYLELMA